MNEYRTYYGAVLEKEYDSVKINEKKHNEMLWAYRAEGKNRSHLVLTIGGFMERHMSRWPEHQTKEQ